MTAALPEPCARAVDLRSRMLELMRDLVLPAEAEYREYGGRPGPRTTWSRPSLNG